jgi:hypothetical protein
VPAATAAAVATATTVRPPPGHEQQRLAGIESAAVPASAGVDRMSMHAVLLCIVDY